MASPLMCCHFLVHLQTHQRLDLSCPTDAGSVNPAQAGAAQEVLLSDDL